MIAPETELIEALEAGNARLNRELDVARATIKRLNRRAQLAESALPEWREFSRLTAKQATGRFFPALMRIALTKAHEEADRAAGALRQFQTDLVTEDVVRLSRSNAELRKENEALRGPCQHQNCTPTSYGDTVLGRVEWSHCPECGAKVQREVTAFHEEPDAVPWVAIKL